MLHSEIEPPSTADVGMGGEQETSRQMGQEVERALLVVVDISTCNFFLESGNPINEEREDFKVVRKMRFHVNPNFKNL